MVTALIVTLLLQAFAMVPRAALENPVVANPVPKKLQKDYDKLWQRFLTGREDDKVMKDTDKLLKKNSEAVPLLIIEAYLDLYAKRTQTAEAKFEQVLKSTPSSRIALSYLADFAFNRNDYGRAYELYSLLLRADNSRADVEPKRQKALLLAIQELIVRASAAEQAGRFQEAESLYLQALKLAPQEPSMHERLGELFAKQTKWEQSIGEYRKAEDLGGPSDDADQHIAEALVKLGRAEEARGILEKLKKSGALDASLEAKVNELEDIGRWGSDLSVFRSIRDTAALTRAQFAVLLVRYFPQFEDVRSASPIITDLRESASFSEIQAVVGNGLLDLRPNRTFQPAAMLTRGELASALARAIGRLNIAKSEAPAIPLTDVASTNARYREIQVAMSYGLMTLDDSGNFNVTGTTSGEEAVRAVSHILDLTRGKR